MACVPPQRHVVHVRMRFSYIKMKENLKHPGCTHCENEIKHLYQFKARVSAGSVHGAEGLPRLPLRVEPRRSRHMKLNIC